MMLTDAHSIVYSMDPHADRAFLRDLLKPPLSVNGGETRRAGLVRTFLNFGLPSSEVGVHPSDKNDRLTRVTLPRGGNLGVYQPLHPRPKQ